MNTKSRAIDRRIAINNIAIVVNENQIAHSHEPEAASEWVYPKVIRKLGVAHGDVPGDAFAEAQSPEHAQGTGQFLFALGALFFDGALRLGADVDEFFGREGDAVNDFGGTCMFGDCHIPRLGRYDGYAEHAAMLCS